jgi:predicted nucleotidyltransferase
MEQEYKIEPFEAVEILVEKIKKDYSGDVSLVHVHGSYFYNDTHDLSDVDLYFVPKTERGFKLGQTFILNGIGFDFWALSWDRLERIADHKEKITSIITDGKIIYYHSDEDLERFNRLKERAGNITDKNKYINNGKEIMENARKKYFDAINCKTIAEARKIIIGIIYDISFALAEINCTPIKRGRKYLLKEIMSMEKVPENFETIYEQLFMEKDIDKLKELLYRLIRNTEKSIVFNQKSAFSDNFNGFYEEMIQSYNKIYHACETGDIYTPLFAAVELTVEIEELFERSNCSYNLPDMAAAYDPDDLGKIKETAERHQAKFVELLNENGIKIRSFEDMGELKKYLDTI